MKTKLLTSILVAGVLATNMSVFAGQSPAKMKMTSPVPPGVGTADKLETSLGTLNSFDGVPDAATAKKVYDNLDSQRATQAYLNSIQIASVGGMRTGILK